METKYVTINGEQLIIDSFNVGEIYSLIVDGVIVISQTTLDEETQTKKSSEISRHFIVEQIDNSVKFLKEIPVSELEKHIEDINSLNAKLFLAKYSNNISLLKKLLSEENNNIALNLTENYFVDANILREIVEKSNSEEILLKANIPTKILNQLATETVDNIILFEIVVNKKANLETLNIVRKKDILRNELLSKIEERMEQ